MDSDKSIVTNWLTGEMARAKRPVWGAFLVVSFFGITSHVFACQLLTFFFVIHAGVLLGLVIFCSPSKLSVVKELEEQYPELHSSISATLEAGSYHELSAKFAAEALLKLKPRLSTLPYLKGWWGSLAVFIIFGLTIQFSLSSSSAKKKPEAHSQAVLTVPNVDVALKNVSKINTRPKIAAPQEATPVPARNTAEANQDILLNSPEGYAGAIEIFTNKNTK